MIVIVLRMMMRRWTMILILDRAGKSGRKWWKGVFCGKEWFSLSLVLLEVSKNNKKLYKMVLMCSRMWCDSLWCWYCWSSMRVIEMVENCVVGMRGWEEPLRGGSVVERGVKGNQGELRGFTVILPLLFSILTLPLYLSSLILFFLLQLLSDVVPLSPCTTLNTTNSIFISVLRWSYLSCAVRRGNSIIMFY